MSRLPGIPGREYVRALLHGQPASGHIGLSVAFSSELDPADYRDYYWLESYLTRTVQPRFARQGWLSAFDFFCIVVWKANRAKSRVAKRLLARGPDLDTVVKALTAGLATQPNAKERLLYLWQWRGDGWGFQLPMATAILAVLYPDEFTIIGCSNLRFAG
jgi:hypothetical protein